MTPTPAPPAHPPGGERQLQLLREQLAAATVTVGEAYRDTARLVRLLEVIGQPAGPVELVERVLGTLSETFSADLTYLVQADGDPTGTVDVLAACGFGDGAAAEVPLVPGLAAQLAAARPLAWASAPGEPVTAAGGVPVHALVHVPLAEGDPGAGALLMTRSTPLAFTTAELHLLRSVASRLRSSVEEGQRRAAVGELANAGHRLARHLQLTPLLDDAVQLLREVTGAQWASAAVVEGGVAVSTALATGRGVAASPADGATSPTAALAAWPAAVRGEVHHQRDLAAGPASEQPLPAPARSLLCVPVLHEGEPVALLHAAHERPSRFSAAAVEAASLLGGYVGAAVSNARLYRALSESEQRLRLVTDAITDMVAVVTADGTLRYASPSYDRQLGQPPAGLVGTDLAALVHPEDRAAFRASLLAVPVTSRVEHRVLDGHGAWLWVESGLGPAPGGEPGVVVSSRLVGDRRRLEAELLRRATHDALTGLANREVVGQVLEASLSGDGPGRVGLLFCDLDEFKAVNDRLGHEAGDDLLRQVAARLQACVRPIDLLARLGGDEFVVVLPAVTDLDAVTAVGDRVLAALHEPFTLAREKVRIGASVGGVVSARGLGARPTDLLRDADAAMYEAKRAGRGRVEVFDAEVARRSGERSSLRADLLAALGRGQLAVHHQPVVDLADGSTRGFQAVLHWDHPVLGAVPQEVLVPLVEETGAVAEVGTWVLEQACAQLTRWQALPGRGELQAWVGVCPAQLADPEFALRTLDLVGRSGVRARDLWLEVTGRVRTTPVLLDQLAVLRAAGVRTTIDGAGVSRASLTQVKQLTFDGLKVDPSLVAGLAGGDGGGPGSGIDRGLVRAVLAVADAAGLSVVAEGVETPAQRDALLALGCREGQGPLFGYPVPAEQATRALVGTTAGRPLVLAQAPS